MINIRLLKELSKKNFSLFARKKSNILLLMLLPLFSLIVIQFFEYSLN